MIFIDLETRSACDLKTEGGRRYAVHPSTQLLTVAWIDGKDEHVWFPTLRVRPPHGLLERHLAGALVHVGTENPVPSGRTLVAHNAWGFDSHVWRRFYGDAEWLDTEPLARSCGLPGGLDALGQRLRGVGKHEEGRARLKKFYKADSKQPGVGDLVMIAAYNLDDVAILKMVWEYCQERPNVEPKVVNLSRKVNDMGLRIDMNLCRKLIELSDEANRETVAEIAKLTDGKLGSLEDLRSRTKMFSWLAEENARIGSSLKRDTLETLFREHDESEEDDGKEIRFSEKAKKVLTLRFSALRISAGKASAALKLSLDGRVHNTQVYYGAHTGRYSGRGLQPHNLPRPKLGVDTWAILDTDLSSAAVRETLTHGATLDDAISGLLRSVIIPDDGFVFAPSDFAGIELRGAAEIAGVTKLQEALRRDEDVYVQMAQKLGASRQIAKVVVLGCQYQMSGRTLALYALAQGVDLEAAGISADAAVEAFRSSYPELAGEMGDRGFRIGGFWNDMNYNAMKAVRLGRSSCGPIEYRYDGRDLKMILPSGRPIYYPQASIEDIPSPFDGRPKKTLVYTSAYGKRQTTYGGKLFENAVQGAMRDVLTDVWVAADEAGFRVPLAVHDELVPMVRDEAHGREFSRLMVQQKDWAKSIPVKAETELMPRYAKKAPKGWPAWSDKSY